MEAKYYLLAAFYSIYSHCLAIVGKIFVSMYPLSLYFGSLHNLNHQLYQKIEITPAQVGLQRRKRLLDLGTAPDGD
jgi:hypothetical protein